MATDEELQAIVGIKRRTLLRGGLLAGAGVVAAGAMSAVLTGTAQAATPNPQPGWAWCEWCSTMFWSAGTASSYCASPFHSRHAVKSDTFNYQHYNDGGSGLGNTTNPQANWFWCGGCQGMFWGPSAKNACASPDGAHKAGSKTNYYIYINEDSGSNSADPQPYWNWCGLCGLLYWQGAVGSAAGWCPSYPGLGAPVSGPHEAGSGTNYCVEWSGTYS